jgi:hypothetical protein
MICRFQLLSQRQMAAGGAMAARQMFSVLGIYSCLCLIAAQKIPHINP